MLRGSEANWVERSVGNKQSSLGYNYDTATHTITHIVWAQPDYDVMDLKPDDLDAIQKTWSAGVYEARNPDVSRFFAKGGKWLVWHGFNDPGPSPLATAAYFEEAKTVVGGKLGRTAAQMDQSMRYFVAPGMFHCGGGPGAGQFDLVAALDRWVTTGAPPDRIVVTSPTSPVRTRPMCPWPTLSRYKGEGDPNVAENFVCR
jgi:feruloyl esterase